jgi:hypothetical protein
MLYPIPNRANVEIWQCPNIGYTGDVTTEPMVKEPKRLKKALARLDARRRRYNALPTNIKSGWREPGSLKVKR